MHYEDIVPDITSRNPIVSSCCEVSLSRPCVRSPSQGATTIVLGHVQQTTINCKHLVIRWALA